LVLSFHGLPVRAATTILNSRLSRLLEIVEEAAGRGCFSVEVPLHADSTLGSASWWWDGGNQTVVGDFLTARGLHVKFRNPRVAGSQYPSLFVDWFDEDHVAELVSDLHNKARAEAQKQQ
jgi:hypothetical protein